MDCFMLKFLSAMGCSVLEFATRQVQGDQENEILQVSKDLLPWFRI